jgi:hypothetical protein
MKSTVPSSDDTTRQNMEMSHQVRPCSATSAKPTGRKTMLVTAYWWPMTLSSVEKM